MIGVACSPSEEPVVREFFELFKTPWEFYRSGRPYRVILCTGDCSALLEATEEGGHSQPHQQTAKPTVVIYSGDRTSFDDQRHIALHTSPGGATLPLSGTEVRISGQSAKFGP